MFYIFLSGYNSRTIQDIRFQFSAILSLVEATKYVKFQSARCTGFKVGIFRISPICPIWYSVNYEAVFFAKTASKLKLHRNGKTFIS